MKCRALLDQLCAYVPCDADERAIHERFCAFVGSEPDCLERSLACGHVTASAWVLDHEGARTLLTHHRKLDCWLQLGGHADGDPDPERVARREVEEESGLNGLVRLGEGIFDLDIHRIPANARDPEHLHYDVRFAFAADAREPLRLNAESKELRWVGLDELHHFTRDRSIQRMAAKGRRIGAPRDARVP